MQAGNKRNLNIVHSEHACSPTSFPPLSNQGHIWILDHAMGDKGTLGGKIPAPELKLLAGKTPMQIISSLPRRFYFQKQEQRKS